MRAIDSPAGPQSRTLMRTTTERLPGGHRRARRHSGRVRHVSAFPAEGIFISYRREDTGPYARLLKVKLSERFPDARVFIDLDSIEAGLDFAEVIESAVHSCVVLVALIGRDWLTITDEDGDRRLDNPDDYVRFEIRTALERCVRVIPVLVDGAKPLRPQHLPPDLGKLARLNVLEMSYGRYEYDETRLMAVIQRVLASGTGGLEAPPGPTSAAASGSRSLFPHAS